MRDAGTEPSDKFAGASDSEPTVRPVPKILTVLYLIVHRFCRFREKNLIK